jgi:uncharacterized RDD family membrane protein YckC
MSTGFRQIYYDYKLQGYWIRRLVAILIDSVMISIAVLIFSALIVIAFMPKSPWWWTDAFVFPFFSGVPLFLYSALTEAVYGFTFGKRVMGLKVVSGGGGRPAINVALLRNATKIYGLALLLDVVVPLAFPGDATKKYTDKVSGGSVVSV